ncbi:MAG: SsrA-binding protein [Planctomycetota bacterium]|jgi:SsrA-binding protein
MVVENRRARYEYLVLEELEVGIVLVGTEVKSLRAGNCSMNEAYATIEERRKTLELVIKGLHIPEYAFGNKMNHKPTRTRRLLAHKREIQSWYKKVREKGVTIVPLEVYFNDSRVKLHLGLARGKRLHDKRATERDRHDKREMERAMLRRR